MRRRQILEDLKEKSPELYNEIVENNIYHQGKPQCNGQSGEFGQNGQCAGHNGKHSHGGRREGAGRPRMFCQRRTITKQISEESINKIKEYANTNNISENQALEILINTGYEHIINNQ